MCPFSELDTQSENGLALFFLCGGAVCWWRGRSVRTRMTLLTQVRDTLWDLQEAPMKYVKVNHPDFLDAELSTILKFQRGCYLAQIQYKKVGGKNLGTVLQIKNTYANGNPLAWANKILHTAASLAFKRAASAAVTAEHKSRNLSIAPIPASGR